MTNEEHYFLVVVVVVVVVVAVAVAVVVVFWLHPWYVEVPGPGMEPKP